MARQSESFTSKMSRIDTASREIIDKEAADRERKTARLRAMRLEKEAAAGQPKRARRTSAKSADSGRVG
ncbi:hypothetical protein ACSBOB_11635 [Mesorhizobium sp. ASY16-5R]|uniref:hypothetical protein n=1 Tax=Mesorhizobium sp. ASY16-5R TaxID=3445772 RepID=UPI003FA01CD6